MEEYPEYFYRCETGKQKELITPRGWEDMSLQLQLMEEFGETVTTQFLGQFFQCSDMIHAFYVYYRRFASMSGTKLMDRLFQRDLTAIGDIQGLTVQDRWALITSVITRIKALTRGFVVEEVVTDVVYDVLKANRKTLKVGGGTAIEALFDLANKEENIQCKEKLLACANAVGGEDGWNDITTFFKKNMVAPLEVKRKETLEQIDGALFLCNESVKDAENMERLVHGMVDHQETGTFLASCESPAFRTLCMNTQFEGNSILMGSEKKVV